MAIRLSLDRFSIKPSLAPAYLFETGDLEPLAGLDDVNVFGRLQQREVCSRIEPCHASSQQFDVERSMSQINLKKIDNLQLSPSGGLQTPSKVRCPVIVKIESGNRVVGFWELWFFLQRQNPSVRCEFYNAVRGRIGDMIAKDGGADPADRWQAASIS